MLYTRLRIKQDDLTLQKSNCGAFMNFFLSFLEHGVYQDKWKEGRRKRKKKL